MEPRRARSKISPAISPARLKFSPDKKQLNVTNCDPRVHELRPV
jgi:hypothetical protein